MSNPPSHPRLVVGGAHLWEGEGRMTRRGEIFSLPGIKKTTIMVYPLGRFAVLWFVTAGINGELNGPEGRDERVWGILSPMNQRS